LDRLADVWPLSQLVALNAYPESLFSRYERDVERLCLPSDSFDMVFSNAVVEHLYDLQAALAQVFRVTRPGGFGVHQVDSRDHRDFDHPLEYLLLSTENFNKLFAGRQGEMGNRYRAGEIARLLSAAGFELLDFEETVSCNPDYLADFLPRLRAAKDSPYRNCSQEELRILSGNFRVRKPSM